MSIRQPLRLTPIFVEKVWGGRTLEEIVPEPLPAGVDVGEAWCLVDREGAASVVAEGPFEGRTLRGLMLSDSEALLGHTRPDPDGSFPLLMKLLDTRRHLSVQVHPNEETANRLGPHHAGKDESWLVLRAAPEAEVFLGLRDGVDARAFAAAGSNADIVELLATHRVEPGDFVRVPAGTVHAIGAGLLIAEVQQNSDTTFRIYDWDRPLDPGAERVMHLDEALQSIRFDQPTPVPAIPAWEDQGSNQRAALDEDACYRSQLLKVHEVMNLDLEGFAGALMILDGCGRLTCEASEEPFELRRGQTWLLPADLGAAKLHPGDGDFTVLQATALQGRGGPA